MRRIGLAVVFAVGLFVAPLDAEGQPTGKVARIGILGIGAAPSAEEVARSPFRAALRDLGWIAGQNLVFESRYAAGQPERLPALAAELARLQVDVIVTRQDQETVAAKRATASIPNRHGL